jgi:hypothetical protein
MIALYADTATEEGRAAVAALAKMPHVHILTTGGRPFAIWGGLCCTGALTIRGLVQTLQLCDALRKTLRGLAPARQTGPW